ncbi:MAG: type III pantothenate kinase [Nitrospirae bacterium]|nr:type III pantothenate kinase [Nitrospirota bacterium]
MNFIAIDIGNSSINIGFFTKGGLFIQKIDTKPLLQASEYSSRINNFIKENLVKTAFEGFIISSVVPGHTDIIKEACKFIIEKEPLILRHNLKTDITFQIKEPAALGTDRIAASVGACRLFGAPVAVIDFGTATTVNFIGKGNIFKGGTIMPGIGLMKASLFKGTAQLPETDISAPLSPLGNNTEENILSGIIYGTAGAVERIINEVEKREGEEFKVAATGGYCHILAPLLKRVDFVESALVLKGLKFIYEMNKS